MLETYLYERITTSDMLPAQVNIITGANITNMPHHWHRSIELDYMMEVDTQIYLNGKEFITGDDTLILINSGDIHMLRSINSRDIKVVSLIISYDFLKERYPEIDDCRFSLEDCPGKTDELKELLKNLYDLFAEKSDPFYIWRGNALIYQVIYLLLRYCCVKKSNMAQSQKTEKYKERFKIIIEYINERYREYLESLRLNYAHNALLNTDYSVLEIAVNSGFCDERALTRSFRKIYGTTPAQYRKECK